MFTHPTDLACGDADHEGVGFDIFIDHGAGADEGEFADGEAADDGAVATMTCRAGGTTEDMDVILDQLASVLRRAPIWYLWRPQLRDANDDMVLEAAANAAATHLVTFNIRDFGTAPS